MVSILEKTFSITRVLTKTTRSTSMKKFMELKKSETGFDNKEVTNTIVRDIILFNSALLFIKLEQKI